MKKAIAAVILAAVIGFLLFLFKPVTTLQPTPTFQPQTIAGTPQPAASHSAVPSSRPSLVITEHDRHLLVLLNQILVSKNDNDLRLDTEFKNLTPGTKELLMQRYQQLPMEARNERGTIVFLIGRELTRPEDFAFLGQVALEMPCMSLANCKKEGSHSEEDVHEEAAISVTLAYPQHVAEKSVENLLNQATQTWVDPARINQAFATLNKMTESPVLSISRKATELLARYADLRNRT